MDTVTDVDMDGSDSSNAIGNHQTIQEFRKTVLADITAMREEIKELKNIGILLLIIISIGYFYSVYYVCHPIIISMASNINSRGEVSY